MARHSDKADQALTARLDGRLERPARPHRHIPVVGMPERVQLDQIDVIDPEPLERPVDVLARLARGPRAGLRGEKEVLPMASHPRPDTQLGVSIASGGVDVIDAVAQENIQTAVGGRLIHLREGGAAEQRQTALMTGPSERPSLDQRGSSYAAARTSTRI